MSGLVPLQGDSAGAVEDLFMERLGSVVFAEYVIEDAFQRQETQAVGVVVSEAGHIAFLPGAFPDWLPPSHIRELDCRLAQQLGSATLEADYLGMDWRTGWHYVQLAAALPEVLRPVQHWGQARPRMGAWLWGIGLTKADLGYLAYLLSGRFAVAQPLPQLQGYADREVAVPGSVVFDAGGTLVGWAGMPVPVERDLWFGADRYRVNLRNPDESYTFLLAEPFLEDLAGFEARLSAPEPWLGLVHTQPLDAASARFLGLEAQGALVIGEVALDSPATEAGLRTGDILVELRGEPVPRLIPALVLTRWLQRAVHLGAVGEALPLVVLRGEERVTVTPVLGEAPPDLIDARREGFAGFGLALRAPVLDDATARRVSWKGLSGVTVARVQAESSAAEAGLEVGDLVLEIDGVPVETLEVAARQVEALREAGERRFSLWRIDRAGEQRVLRLPLEAF